MRDGFLDLYLGGSCLGRAEPGRLLCPSCAGSLPRVAAPRWPTPVPEGLVTPYAVAPYEGVVREMINGHKDRQLAGLRTVLGDLLAHSVRALLEDRSARGSVVLVPVPSRRASVRARGRDATRQMTERAARVLAPYDVKVAPVLRLRPGVVDQAGLDASRRRTNLHGSMACASAAVARLARSLGEAHVIVCDDVLTTGATLREAQRALAATGVPVLGHATVAATVRRRSSGVLGESSAR